MGITTPIAHNADALAVKGIVPFIYSSSMT
jgi:hypothetical protein